MQHHYERIVKFIDIKRQELRMKQGKSGKDMCAEKGDLQHPLLLEVSPINLMYSCNFEQI
jgi:hypothetical protein